MEIYLDNIAFDVPPGYLDLVVYFRSGEDTELKTARVSVALKYDDSMTIGEIRQKAIVIAQSFLKDASLHDQI